MEFPTHLVTAYSSSSSAGAGAFNSNSYQGQSYSPEYPYVNNYAGYAGAGGFPNYVQDPYVAQAQFQQYFNQLSAYNAKYAQFFSWSRSRWVVILCCFLSKI